MGSQLFQPNVVIMKQAILSVVDIDTGCNVHGVHEAKALFDAAFTNEVFDRVSDI